MAPSNSTTAFGSAATDRPNLLHAPDTFARKKTRGSALSRLVPRSFRQQIFTSKHGKSRSEDLQRSNPHHRKTDIQPTKASLRMPWSERRRRKSVTFEEPVDNTHGVIGSDGTVRRPQKTEGLDSSQVVPGFWPEDPGGNKGGNNDNHGYGQYLDVPTGDRQPAEVDVAVREPHNQDETGRKASIRTVSHDDILTGRGANPRTGLVSPSLSSGSRPSKERAPRHGREKSQHSRKWRLKDNQWISMDADDKTPSARPNNGIVPPGSPDYVQDHAQAYLDHLTKSAIPLRKMDEKLIVDMPSANDPNPPTMSTQQISEFQRAIDRLRRHGGPPVDPETPPTPRVQTPEGKSSPPNRLVKDQKRPANSVFRRHRAPEVSGGRRAQYAPQLKRTGFLPQQARTARDVLARKASNKRFLVKQEAMREDKAPVFQREGAFLSQPPPWMKATTSSKRDGTQELQDENDAGNHTSGRREAAFRKSMVNLPLNPSMRTLSPGQPKNGPTCTTTTTTSTMAETCEPPPTATTTFHQGGIPQAGDVQGTGNRTIAAHEERDCESPCSSLFPKQICALPILSKEPMDVDIADVIGGKPLVSIEKSMLDGASGTPADYQPRSNPPSAIQTVKANHDDIYKGHSRCQTKDMTVDNKPKVWNIMPQTIFSNGNMAEGKQIPEYCNFSRNDASFKHPDKEPTLACICSHLQQAVFSALLFCLNTMIYLCDQCWVFLRVDSEGKRALSIQNSDASSEAQGPELNKGILGSIDWLWPLAGTAVCVILLVFVLRGVAYILRIGLWAFWLLRLFM